MLIFNLLQSLVLSLTNCVNSILETPWLSALLAVCMVISLTLLPLIKLCLNRKTSFKTVLKLSLPILKNALETLTTNSSSQSTTEVSEKSSEVLTPEYQPEQLRELQENLELIKPEQLQELQELIEEVKTNA